MKTSRRGILQGAGLGSALALWPFSSLPAAGPKRRDVYRELGLRPIVNFQGTYTSIGASKQAQEVFEAQAAASEYVVIEELQEKIGERISKLIGSEHAMVRSPATTQRRSGSFRM